MSESITVSADAARRGPLYLVPSPDEARAPKSPVPLAFPLSSLVIIGGLPGAGKTTLVRRLSGLNAVRALDSEDVARWLSKLPVRYGVLRPVVHTVHLVRVLAALWSHRRCVLTSDPMTGPVRRHLLRIAARCTGRKLYVILLQATPTEARNGQQRRGRTLSARRMARHEQRYQRLLAAGTGNVDLTLTRNEATRAVLAWPEHNTP